MTGRWPRGDQTHPRRVRSIIAKQRCLAEGELKDQMLALALTGVSDHFFRRADAEVNA